MSLFPENMMKSTELSLDTIAERLSYFELQLHLLHWKTTVYARHMAIGALYDYIFDFKDGVIEKLMGYTGKRVGTFRLPPISDMADEEMVVNDLINFASNLKSFADRNGYLDIGNLADSLSGEAAKTKYLFTLS